MRPRLITAENFNPPPGGRPGDNCFNEAAAHHRGEPQVRGLGAERRLRASMRPRLITAENLEQNIHRIDGTDVLQ